MLSVIRLNVVMLSALMLSVANTPFMLSVIMLCAVMLSVFAPYGIGFSHTLDDITNPKCNCCVS